MGSLSFVPLATKIVLNVWVEPGLLIRKIGVAIHENLENICVSDLDDDLGNWKFDVLDCLPQSLINKIKAILPPSHLAVDDKRLWSSRDHKGFSVASAYNLLYGVDGSHSQFDWNLFGASPFLVVDARGVSFMQI